MLRTPGARQAVAGGLLVLLAAAAQASISDCLDCHGDDSLTMAFGDGDEVSLFVDEAEFLASVHGRDLLCTDCHQGYEDDHPGDRTFASRRRYVIESYGLCKGCHFDTYTRTLESAHYEYLSQGSEAVPVCADCHGSHAIQDPHQTLAMISRSCRSCHQEVYDRYLGSVHGAALTEGHRDVPGCVDCHTAHLIAHPDTVRFRLRSPQGCLRCHGDAELSAKYGLSSTVGQTYLADFHGLTAELAAESDVEPAKVVVVCIDCHGYHEIASPAEVGAGPMQAKVREVCASCHQDAAPDFPAAWLSHYPPTLAHAPLVFLVKSLYNVLIPFTVAGLFLQICMHLYRAGVRR